MAKYPSETHPVVWSAVVFVPSMISHDRVLLLTRQLLNQVFIVVKLMSSLRSFTESLSRKWPLICSVGSYHYPIISSSMMYQQFCSNSNTTGATNGVGTVYSFFGTRVRQIFWGDSCCSCCQIRCLHVFSPLWFLLKKLSDLSFILFIIKRVHGLFMLFVFIYVYWCSTRFQMMFVSLKSDVRIS